MLLNHTLARFAVTTAIAASAVGVADATWTEFYVVKTQTSNSGINLDVYKLYARFNGPTDTVLNAFNLDRTTSAGILNGFYHKDNFDSPSPGVLSTAVGSWNPALTGSATLNRPYDSYLTIGGIASATNGTSADPSWGSPLSWNRPDIPNNVNAGWFAPGGSIAGRVGQAGNLADSTRLGQFSIARDSYAGVWNMKLGYNNGVAGSAVQFAESTFSIGVAVPAPGAIALLGLAGLTGRRRR